MIFTPDQDTVLQTKIQSGDLIRIHPKGSVLIFRQDIALQFTETETSIEFHTSSPDGINHDYAWFIAQAIASIAGLFVVDSYEIHECEPTGIKFHQFPVTDEPPIFIEKSSKDNR